MSKTDVCYAVMSFCITLSFCLILSLIYESTLDSPKLDETGIYDLSPITPITIIDELLDDLEIDKLIQLKRNNNPT